MDAPGAAVPTGFDSLRLSWGRDVGRRRAWRVDVLRPTAEKWLPAPIGVGEAADMSFIVDGSAGLSSQVGREIGSGGYAGWFGDWAGRLGLGFLLWFGAARVPLECPREERDNWATRRAAKWRVTCRIGS